MATQKRGFKLDQHAISMLIQAQAGSLQKAILEAVSNALDAGATKIKVDLSADRVEIEDDGKGFKSEKEIEDFFATFGFDHSQLDRTVGRFGVGRGQLFHFGKNLWTTNGFTMAVDTKTDMFGYDFGTAKKPHKGVKIAIDLYSPLTFSQLNTVETELKKLVKYSTIPVILNGQDVTKNPKTIKWDAETDDAWFKMDDSRELNVYSQGLFVQGLGAYQFGKGGVVVTKLGHPLKQNMARNDMLITDCEVWKRIRKTISGLSKDHQKKVTTSSMTEAMRSTILLEALNGDGVDAIEAFEKNIFTLTNGRHVKLSSLLSYGYVSKAENKDPAADIFMQRLQAAVINSQTLSRAGVETVSEFADKIKVSLDRLEAMSRIDYKSLGSNGYSLVRELQKRFNSTVFTEKVSDFPMQANTALVEVKDREATADERIALAMIRRNLIPSLSHAVHNRIHQESLSHWQFLSSPQRLRTVRLCNSEAALASTDGASRIWVDRSFLQKCIKEGAAGFVRLANVMTHELVHDVDSTTGHDHDTDFYQAYHDLTVDGSTASLGFSAFRQYLARGGKASSNLIQEMEKGEMITPEDVNARRAAMANPSAVLQEIESETVQPAFRDVKEVASVDRKPARKSHRPSAAIQDGAQIEPQPAVIVEVEAKKPRKKRTPFGPTL